MNPILDVRPVRPGLFTYNLRAPGQPARPFDNFFDALDLCLEDAARSLGHYFDHVQVRVQGVPAGIYSIERLLMEPLGIVNELTKHFALAKGPPAGCRAHPSLPLGGMLRTRVGATGPLAAW